MAPKAQKTAVKKRPTKKSNSKDVSAKPTPPPKTTAPEASNPSPRSTSNGERLRNPTHPDNWPNYPKTNEEFEQWIIETQDALRRWLTETRARVVEEDAVLRNTTEGQNIWLRLEPTTDIETGRIANRSDITAIEKGMKKLYQDRKEVHAQYDTWTRHVERRCADASWEDFLYYQNEWNRKDLDPGRNFYESKSDRMIGDATKKREVENIAKDSRDSSIAIGDQHEITYDQSSNLYRPMEKDMEPLQRPSDGYLGQLYIQWRNNMINLYSRFHLADRMQIPDVVAPEHAHRYSQPPRGDANSSNSTSDVRREHLNAKFPRSKKHQRTSELGPVVSPQANMSKKAAVIGTETGEVVDARSGHGPDIGDKQSATVLATGNRSWRIDGKSAAQMKRRCEKGALFEKAENAEHTLELLSDGHVLHHGSQETSFDWPTSFDVPAEGDHVAITLSRKRYIYENDADVANLDKEALKLRRDKANGKIRKIDERPRYTKVRVGTAKRKKVFKHARNADGTLVGRRNSGEWVSEEVIEESWDEDFVWQGKVGSGARQTMRPQFLFQREFQVRLTDIGPLTGTRRQNLERSGKLIELSDEETEDRPNLDNNYARSGHSKHGWILSDGDPSEDKVESDDDDDDDSDIFRSSYQDGGTNRQ